MAGESGLDDPPLTQDTLFGGRLVLRQPAKGHRAGTDAVLLAAAVPRTFAGLAYDAGAGVGTAGLGLALACPAARVGLIENEPLGLKLAADNIVLNGLSSRVALHACDLLSAANRRAAAIDGKAALVVSNPPFYVPGAVRLSPDARRQAAHVGGAGGLEAWIASCLALLDAQGTLIVIHVAEALPGLLTALEGRAGALTLLAIHTKPDAPAKRILLRAVKGSRAPFVIAPSVTLRDDKGLTIEGERLHRGETALTW